MVRELGEFSVGVAAFPQGHPESSDLDAAADVLVVKADAGADFAITQLFFDRADYFRLVGRVRARGCDLPIIPGVMPITNAGQLTRFTKLSGSPVPVTCGFLSPQTPKLR